MTYIEFFDKPSIENICSCLAKVPDRVIFIGSDSRKMKRRIADYTRVFNDRGENIEFLFKAISQNHLDNAVRVLSEIVETYDNCMFDITGGAETLNVALGIVYSKYSHKNIQIQRFGIRSNKVYDCDKDGNVMFETEPKLTIEENIRIYGGDISYGGIGEGKCYKWDMNSKFEEDVKRIWDVCKYDVRAWNAQVGIFGAINSAGNTSEGGLTTAVMRDELDSYFRKNKLSYDKSNGIIRRLRGLGLITRYEEEPDTVTISYKSRQVKRCLTVAGLALELKIYSTIRSVTDDEGRKIYNDVMNGVVIDWDGKFHDEDTDKIIDTENEIDVLAMHNLIPVYISCKNGNVTSDELFKLDTVAERFGGKYSKRVLVATALNTMKDKGIYVRQRAKDMNIILIEDIQSLSDRELEDKLKNLWNT